MKQITLKLDIKTAKQARQAIAEAAIIDTAADELLDELQQAIERYDEVNSDEPLVVNGVPYRLPSHKQFIKDMEAAGYDIRMYHGRNFYNGPAVACDRVQEITSNTNVVLGWDQLGLGVIVHPSESDYKLKDARDDSD